MTIHLIGLPHTGFDADRYSSCAFTAKAVRFTRMMRMIERDVLVYWGAGPSPEPVQVVTCLSRSDQLRYFGEYDANKLPVVQWDASLPYWKEFHANVASALRLNLKPGDYIAVVGGAISQCIVDEFKNDYTCIEAGVGYEGICRGTFACFESYAWRHHRYGAYGINDGRAFDTVIPNSYDPHDFTTGQSHGYALFVGRLITRKGPQVAADISERLGLPLMVAGAGGKVEDGGLFTTTEGQPILGSHVEWIGSVSPGERKTLMAGAELMITPTLYIGPFEGVHVESLLSGVPVIAPDYGVFTETLPRAWRYSSMKTALQAAENARKERGNNLRIRQDAIAKYSLDVCAKKYDEWFAQLDTLRGGAGWYQV